MKVCLDTNVVVSAFATQGVCNRLLEWIVTERALCLTTYVLDELLQKLSRKLRFTDDEVKTAQALLTPFVVNTPVGAHPAVPRVRDADDRPVLDHAAAVKADFLITGDKDLLVLAGQSPVPILSTRDFWMRYCWQPGQ